MGQPNYTDFELQEIQTNTTLILSMDEPYVPHAQYEDTLQCVLLLLEDLKAARKRIQELEKKNAG